MKTIENMKRFVLILFILHSSCFICPIHAQKHIQNLLPALKDECKVLVCQNFDHAFMLGDDGAESYSFSLRNVRKSVLSDKLLGRLQAAFEAELPLATESDRYQLNVPGKDTLSYSLIYQGRIHDGNGDNIQFYNRYVSPETKGMASLDMNKTHFSMQYYATKKTNAPLDVVDVSPVTDFLAELERNEQVKVVDVQYKTKGDIDHGAFPNYNILKYSDGEGNRIGKRYEVPAHLADSVRCMAENVIESYVGSKQRYYISSGSSDFRFRNLSPFVCETYLALGKWEHAFSIRLMEDGRLFLLNIRATEGTVYIPGEWTDIVNLIQE